MKAIETAADRYKDLLTAVVPALTPELRADALKVVIDRAGANPAPALSEHIAVHSQLTAPQTEPLVVTALAGVPGADSTEKGLS